MESHIFSVCDQQTRTDVKVRAGAVGLESRASVLVVGIRREFPRGPQGGLSFRCSPPLTQFFLECGGLVRTDKKPALCKSYQKLVSDLWNKNRWELFTPTDSLVVHVVQVVTHCSVI